MKKARLGPRSVKE